MSELNSADQEIMRLATEAEPEGTPEAKPEGKVEAKEPLELGGEEAPEATEEEVEAEEKRKGRSHSPIQRINTLTARLREAEREAAELRARVVPEAQAAEDSAPDPNAKNPDGSDMYDYGEADPRFLRDYATFAAREAIREERKTAKEAEAKTAEQTATYQRLNESREKLVKEGTEKYDDFEAKITAAAAARDEPLHPLINVGVHVSPAGADITYLLATDPETTEKLEGLAQTDPKRAAMMFGELEAQYLDNDDDTDLNLNDPWDDLRQRGRDRARRKGLSKSVERKTSKAPEPPENRARGAGGKFEVGDDTSDFAAYEAKIMGTGKR